MPPIPAAELGLWPRVEETIEGTSSTLRAGQTTCVEILERCLARIEAYEPMVRAWVVVDREAAWKQARALDSELAAGKSRGILHGIPIGIKDIVDVAGFATAAGSRRRETEIAGKDAPLVARLRAAGSVILGKTVTTQFASFDPPVTRNPWNLERTPGGSSSGSAAAVALNMCLGAIGSQTGGSITRPASYCGVAGCKPTFGRVSLEGIVPLAETLDHPGPMARSVRGLAAILDAIADWPASGPADAKGAAFAPISAALEQGPGSPPRIGRLGGIFATLAEPSARGALDRAMSELSRGGAHVAEAALPERFDDVLRNHRVLMAAGAAAVHEQRMAEFPDDYLPKIRSLIEEGMGASPSEVARCRGFQEQMKQEIEASFGGFDLLACPATVGPAPGKETTGDPAMNSPWSFTGLPTICLPVSLSPDGLPLGVQLVGRRDSERELFLAAAWCERVLRSSSV